MVIGDGDTFIAGDGMVPCDTQYAAPTDHDYIGKAYYFNIKISIGTGSVIPSGSRLCPYYNDSGLASYRPNLYLTSHLVAKNRKQFYSHLRARN